MKYKIKRKVILPSGKELKKGDFVSTKRGSGCLVVDKETIQILTVKKLIQNG
jgi:hypothetical protein